MKNRHFFRADEELRSDVLHYRDCGLENIYLLNGFDKEEHEGEEFLSISDVDGLHRAIGMHIVLHRKAPSGKEIRFLRNEMDMSQAGLADILGVSDQSVARWEKGETEAPGPAVLALRLVYILSLMPDKQKHELVDQLLDINQKLSQADETCDVARFSYQGHEWLDDLVAA